MARILLAHAHIPSKYHATRPAYLHCVLLGTSPACMHSPYHFALHRTHIGLALLPCLLARVLFMQTPCHASGPKAGGLPKEKRDKERGLSYRNTPPKMLDPRLPTTLPFSLSPLDIVRKRAKLRLCPTFPIPSC
jgi:hypothetical protein